MFTYLINRIMYYGNLIKDVFRQLIQFSPVSLVFITFIILIMVLNLIKRWLVWQERMKATADEKCQFLKSDRKGQYCSLPACAERFLENEKGCTGCRKKSSSISTEEAETRAKNSSLLNGFIICVANGGKSILPYLSFVYTLTLTIMGISQNV